jgi:hypothetical protein
MMAAALDRNHGRGDLTGDRDRATDALDTHIYEEGVHRMGRKGPPAGASQDADAVIERGAAALTSGDPEAEIGSLARQLAREYAELVEAHRRSWGITAAEAEEKARMPRDRSLEMVRMEPVEQIPWWMLATVMEHDPEAALAAWKRIGDAARQEWQSGHRTAQSLERGGTPWDRARFLALREAFRDDWKPRGGIESSLVDLLAQSFGTYLRWMERLELYVETECRAEDSKLAREGYWMPPRVSEAKWMAWCAEQAEAAHRRFLMTLKSLQDLRRLPAVSIATAGQVNIAQQQVNVSSDDAGGTSE